jgi:nicotinamidase-related amidase
MKTKLSVILIIFFLGQLSAFPQEKKESEPEPLKPALVIIDIQNQHLNWVPEEEKGVALYFINAYISLFRKHELPVIRVYHTDPESGPSPDSDAFQFPDMIKITEDDPMIIKNYPNAFKKTDLEKILRENNCNLLMLCGLSATACVISTYFGAKDLDFKTFMLKNAIMSHNPEYTDDIEIIFDAISYDAASVILEQAGK